VDQIVNFFGAVIGGSVAAVNCSDHGGSCTKSVTTGAVVGGAAGKIWGGWVDQDRFVAAYVEGSNYKMGLDLSSQYGYSPNIQGYLQNQLTGKKFRGKS